MIALKIIGGATALLLIYTYAAKTPPKKEATFSPPPTAAMQVRKPAAPPSSGLVQLREEMKTPERPADPFPDSAFRGIPLQKDDIRPWLKKGGIKSIHFMDGYKLHVIRPSIDDHKSPSPKYLFISTEALISQVIQERQLFTSDGPGPEQEKHGLPPSPEANGAAVEKLALLDASDYELVRFIPGLRDDLKTPIVQDKDLKKAIRGPDFDPTGDARGPLALKKLRSTLISLGHGGELVLKVKGDGFLGDGPGADFAVYENPFRFGPGNSYLYHEFGYVAVAYDDISTDYKWFKCDPVKVKLAGCGGVVPTDEGGDRFDLGQLGVKKVRYIKIKDYGQNFNNYGEDTEGFDFDAIQLLNAYQKRRN